MTTFCPYCDEEIEDAIHNEWIGDYIEDFDFKCPKCGETLEINVEQQPYFHANKPEVNR